MKVLLYGNGKLGGAVREVLPQCGIEIVEFRRDTDPTEHFETLTAAVYCGRGTMFPDMLGFCESSGVPLVNLSTATDAQVLKNSRCPYIKVPNASESLVNFRSAFMVFAKILMQSMGLRIEESHQRTKPDKSGTARSILAGLGLNEEIIKMIREPKEQVEFGVPEEHLPWHAYHKYLFSDNEVEIDVITKVHGGRAYAKGLVVILERLDNRQLEDGIYTVNSMRPEYFIQE